MFPRKFKIIFGLPTHVIPDRSDCVNGWLTDRKANYISIFSLTSHTICINTGRRADDCRGIKISIFLGSHPTMWRWGLITGHNVIQRYIESTGAERPQLDMANVVLGEAKWEDVTCLCEAKLEDVEANWENLTCLSEANWKDMTCLWETKSEIWPVLSTSSEQKNYTKIYFWQK